MKSALQIAHDAQLRPITDIAASAGILPEELEQSGQFRGKVRLSILDRLASRPNGKLVIVKGSGHSVQSRAPGGRGRRAVERFLLG